MSCICFVWRYPIPLLLSVAHENNWIEIAMLEWINTYIFEHFSLHSRPNEKVLALSYVT